MFKGLSPIDIIEREPRLLIFILSDELKRTNEALEAVNEELKHIKESIEKKG